ncbi:unnamed protein product [Owenia fusiformis]|uniref:EF-hand domain-containing protein n=1 Tax=Owenia fusiformis TaxID=6347 RepID=A0A8S4NQ83_OWEFU|nr:unnamed protein product [Owenia fusiformis]
MAGGDSNNWPRKRESEEYLEKHRILELFNNLTSQLIYSRPENPKEFTIDLLEKLKKSRMTHLDFPSIFDESNVRSVFGMLDPTGRGYITLSQYKEALTTLGVENFDMNPAGGEYDKITMETFVREAKSGIAKASATFYENKA